MKKLKLHISNQAIEDLADIWAYIALDNSKVADNFIEQLHKTCELLTTMPEMGRSRDELYLGLRGISYKGYMIFYQISPNAISIVRILNGCMDIDVML